MTTLLTRITRSLTTVAAIFGLACALPAQATETIIYLHNDISGSPQAATDASGNLLWKESYTPYGERTVNSPASSTGKGTNQLYFHGKKVEDLNGGVHLSYFGARYYDPSLGRFLQIDPQPFDPNNIHSFNRYAYGNNNPYRFVDPDGRNPAAATLLLHVGAGAVLGGASAAAFNAGAQFYMTGRVEWRGLGGVFDAMAEGAQIGAIVGPAYAGYVGSVRGAVARGLPDAALVCRGGSCRAANFAEASGATKAADGTMQGVSVNSAAGLSLEELSVGIPHGKLGVTTVGEIRKAGGNVVASPSGKNPNHATMNGVSPERAEQLFTPTVRNPNAK